MTAANGNEKAANMPDSPTERRIKSSTINGNETASASMPDSPTERRVKSRTLLEEVEEHLAQSLMVFLVADLRLLSATGRIETKYETLAIASDPPSRSTAQELAGMKGPLPKNKVSERLVDNMEEGLSPAQIMAVLIIELKKTVEARRKEEERKRAEGLVFTKRDDDDDEYKDDKLLYFEPDKRGGFKLRANEEDMHSLLRAYADMIGEDLKGEVPHIARRASTLYITESSSGGPRHQQVQQSLSRIDEGDEGSTSTKSEVPVSSQQNIGQAMGKMAADAVQQVQQAQAPLHQRAEALRQSLMTGPLIADHETRTNAEFGEVTDALFKQGASGSSRQLNDSIGRNMLQGNFTEEELLEFMEKAVESRVYGNLDFLADFFRDGTVSKLMAESNARVVWMNDWYPLKDLTYAIAVDKEKRRVLVVFRGAITRQDWARAYESRKFKKVDNPIEEDYDEKTDTIEVSRGFYQYLFRRRKDTGTTKYDEIANMAMEYGKERIGEKFHLVVTGHSLGGALSTMFSFYASTDDRFTANGPVKCFNFGCPYVGGYKFLMAFHHQEQSHKIQYARFFNHNDVVAHLPFNFRVTRYGGKFRPLGISIRLPAVPYGLWGRVRGWHPNVFYVKKEGFLRSYFRAIRDNFLLKIPLPPWRFKEMHTLNEMQKRLIYGQRVGAGNDFALLSKSIDELYDLMIGTSYCKGTANGFDTEVESEYENGPSASIAAL